MYLESLKSSFKKYIKIKTEIPDIKKKQRREMIRCRSGLKRLYRSGYQTYYNIIR